MKDSSNAASNTPIKDRIHDLAKEHGLFYVSHPLDGFAAAITHMSGDDIKMDDTELLIVALVRAGVVAKKDVPSLYSKYLREKAGQT